MITTHYFQKLYLWQERRESIVSFKCDFIHFSEMSLFLSNDVTNPERNSAPVSFCSEFVSRVCRGLGVMNGVRLLIRPRLLDRDSMEDQSTFLQSASERLKPTKHPQTYCFFLLMCK